MANNHVSALRAAIELAGGQAALAEICGCKRQNIHQALQNGRGLPAAYVERVSEKLDIPKHILRPDLFPKD